MQYLIIPDCGDGCKIPTTPCPITAEEVGINLTQRLKMMETQGYWKDCRMRQIPIGQVTYLVVAAEEETEEDDD